MSLVNKIFGNKYVRNITKGSFLVSAPWMISNHFYRPYEICYHTGDFGAVVGYSLVLDGILEFFGKGRFIEKYAPEISAVLLTAGVALTEIIDAGFNVPDSKDIPGALIGGLFAYIWTKGDKIERSRKENKKRN